jgi:hypothetical protein
MRQLTRAYVVAAALVLAVPGCRRGAPTPEAALQALERAVAAGDASAFYECLDSGTKGSIDSAYKDQRLQRTIIQAKFPEAEAGPALERLSAAAADDAKQFFVRIASERKVVEGFRKRLGSVSGTIQRKEDGPDAVWLVRPDGLPFHFDKNRDGSWGFAELKTEWGLERDRSSHAVKTVRDNAALYQKAGTP